MKKIKLTESYLHKVINESIKKVLKEEDEPMGTDEEFNDFMRWSMTDGNDYGFGDAASDYVNGGDESKLYMIATQYSKLTGVNVEVAFSMCKEAAEGIYGSMDDMFGDPIDLSGMDAN